MAFVVRIGSTASGDESVAGPFTSRRAAAAFRDQLQARIDALPDNADGVWTAVTPLERPALATLVRRWGLRRPDDLIHL